MSLLFKLISGYLDKNPARKFILQLKAKNHKGDFSISEKEGLVKFLNLLDGGKRRYLGADIDKLLGVRCC